MTLTFDTTVDKPPANVEAVIDSSTAVSSPTASIHFDRDIYTWTDKVKIEIIAPNHNLNASEYDKIGSLDANRVRITTRGHELDYYTLVETGPDTGIFTGEVVLTGFPFDVDGNAGTGDANGFDTTPKTQPLNGGGPTDGFIEADDDDNITVSFESSSGKTAVETAFIRWNISEVHWLESLYPSSGTAIVTVIDPDMNLDPESVDNFDIDVWSDTDKAGIQLTVTEKKEATGIFEGTVFFSTSFFSSGHRLRVTPSDIITASYDDHTLPDPYTTLDELHINAVATINGTPNVPSPTTSIHFNQDIYSWTDKVEIEITASNHNINANQYDRIGSSDANRVRIVTRGHELDHYTFVETGPDTGIFFGEVILTGFHHDADGKKTTGDNNGNDLFPITDPAVAGGPGNGFIESKNIDGISVTFQTSSAETIVKSAEIRWNIGNIYWEKSHYGLSDPALVRVTDPDMNLNPKLPDRFDVDVWSASDAGGIDLTLFETDVDSGVFEGIVYFSADEESSGSGLRIAFGDVVTAEYEDNTLPHPYHVADELDIVGTAIIDHTGSSSHTGFISLDRSVYPVPFGSVADFFPGEPESDTGDPNGDSIFPVHHTAVIADADSNVDVNEVIAAGDLTIHIRINDPDFDVNAEGIDTIAIGDHGPVKIMVQRGTETLILATAGGVSTNSGVITNGPTIISGVTRDLGPIQEIEPNAGIFELDFVIRYTDGPANTLGPETPNDGYTLLAGSTGVLGRFDAEPKNGSYSILRGDSIVVEYIDPVAVSGNPELATDGAVFDLYDGVLQTDKSVYIIGGDLILTLIEPDLDLDNDSAETYSLDLIEWNSNAPRVTLGTLGGESAAFDPEPSAFRETGVSTGIFQAVIEIPEKLKGNLLDRGEEIALEYTDWGPAVADFVGSDHENINWTISTSSGAAVELDQAIYSWTDKVYITIVAPDFNFNSGLVDTIGDTVSNPIRIETRGATLDNYLLVETGRDSGIFTGEVILTGFLHDADGDPITGDDFGFDTNPKTQPLSGGGPTDGFITADDDDKITVSFEYFSGKTAVETAFIRWNTGEVQWLESSYSGIGTGVVRVIDPDMNLTPEVVDNFDIDVWSDTDKAGMQLTVTETNETTGIFEGTVFFSTSFFSSGHQLRVTPGDTIIASYDDHTLPDPYTTLDELHINAEATINGTPNVPSPTASIHFNQDIYSWTDKVEINITAPNHNTNASQYDTIGSSDDNRVCIATRGHGLDYYTLVETGANTGVFSGEITLTGFLHDADGDSTTGNGSGIDLRPVTKPVVSGGPKNGFIEAKNIDGISVSFQASATETVGNSAEIQWNMGTIHWE